MILKVTDLFHLLHDHEYNWNEIVKEYEELILQNTLMSLVSDL